MENTKPSHGINGRRGAFQLVFGIFYLIVGSSFFLSPNTASIHALFYWLPTWLPLGVFAALWIAAGSVAVVCAFRPRPKDAAGFIAAVFAPGIWFGLFAISWAVTGISLALVQAIIYGVFAVVPLIVSGMEGPHDRDHREVS